MTLSPCTLTAALKAEAKRLGFELVGATPAAAPAGIEHLRRWLADGCAGQMHYFAARIEAYEHPRHVLPGVRSLLILGMNYRTAEPAPIGAAQAAVSRYAWGADYHDVIHQRLGQLADLHRRLVSGSRVRGVVDTAPLLERELAARAGLGWVGKNTMLVSQQFGSWLFLAALLSSEEMEYDEPAPDRCGSCRACVEACPTGALLAPHRLDARRCISYLTIELRGEVPAELRGAIGSRLFGCDACQEVCPWNRCTPISEQSAFQPRPGMKSVALADLLELDETSFRERFRSTPLWRARQHGILRNAAIVCENSGNM